MDRQTTDLGVIGDAEQLILLDHGSKLPKKPSNGQLKVPYGNTRSWELAPKTEKLTNLLAHSSLKVTQALLLKLKSTERACSQQFSVLTIALA